VIIVVNLDPHGAHEDTVELPVAEFGIAADAAYSLEEAFTGRAIACRGAYQRFHLEPAINPALVFCLRQPPGIHE
jgi:starch synthase (maltosyl-transferring)